MNQKNLLPAIKRWQGDAGDDRRQDPAYIEHGEPLRLARPRPQPDGFFAVAYSLPDQAVALDEAREGIVLLKNDGKLLPLDKSKIKTILVIGPDAYPGAPVGGGSAGVAPFHTVSALEGIGADVGPGATVLYDRGLPSLKLTCGHDEVS
jgi:beta-glucosidase